MNMYRFFLIFILIFFFECRQLCVLLNSEDIFRTLAIILLDEEDLEFASSMVEHLNTILLMSPELFSFRVKLKDLKTEVSIFPLIKKNKTKQ